MATQDDGEHARGLERATSPWPDGYSRWQRRPQKAHRNLA